MSCTPLKDVKCYGVDVDLGNVKLGDADVYCSCVLRFILPLGRNKTTTRHDVEKATIAH